MQRCCWPSLCILLLLLLAIPLLAIPLLAILLDAEQLLLLLAILLDAAAAWHRRPQRRQTAQDGPDATLSSALCVSPIASQRALSITSMRSATFRIVVRQCRQCRQCMIFSTSFCIYFFRHNLRHNVAKWLHCLHCLH